MSIIEIPSSLTPVGGLSRVPGPYCWTREEYYRLGDGGIFRDRRVQLIEGQIIEMPPQKEPHSTAIMLTDYVLRPIFAGGFTIRIQLPLHLGDASEPEPDIAVAVGSPRDFLQGHPRTAALVIEVSDATLDFDRRIKARLYEAAGIPEYWIINLVDRRLEVFRSSAGVPIAGYSSATVFSEGDFISPLAAPGVKVAVGDLLP